MSLTACINLTEPKISTELVKDYSQNNWLSNSKLGEMTGALQTSVFEQIQMPALVKLIDEAINANQALLADEADYLALAFASNQAAADLLPSLTLESTSTRSKERSLFSDDNTYVRDQNVQLFASWELDFWGRIRAERRQEKAGMKRAKYELAASRDALFGLVTRQWLSLWLTNQQIRIEQERVEIFFMLQNSASEQYANGLTNYEDVSLAQISLKTAQASVMQLQYTRSEIARQIEVLVGRYPSAELTYNDAFPDIQKPILSIPSEVIANRPDIQAAYAKLHETHFQLEAQNRALLPSFTLSASAGKSRPSWGDIFDSSLLWSVVGGISQSLFIADLIDAGPLTLTKTNEQLKRAATLRYRQTVLDAFLEIENALALEGNLVEQQALLVETVVHAKSVYIDYTERYQNGLVNFIDLLTIQEQYLNAQLTLLETQAGLLYNRVKLGLALGISTQHNLLEDQLGQV
ncbi:TolC family protein [Paraglaciecola sp.]|uniref:TolC family protein n=1 Tax=Paraglaciecola sp. TaxID=1920173 RepID=UPI0030F40D3F